MKDNIDVYEEIVKYLKSKIRDMYKEFDQAHNVNHFDEVFKTCARLAVADDYTIEEQITIEIAAAYHDVGLKAGYEQREIHETLSIPYLVEDEELEALIKQEHIHIRNHRTKCEATCEMDQILKDADSTSLLDMKQTVFRVVAFYLDNIYQPGDDIVKITNNRYAYLNTTMRKKMETKFKSMAAIKIGLKPQWSISDITKDYIAGIILEVKRPEIDLF